jgi:hypothetical protein
MFVEIKYYKVMFDDGDVYIEIYPDEDDEDFEDYDNTDLDMVRKLAGTVKFSKIIEVTEKEIEQ